MIAKILAQIVGTHRAIFEKLKNRKLAPAHLSASIAVGVFVGCSPFYGFHLILCAGLCYLLRLDVVVAYLAANLSVPPVIPFLVFAEAQVGTYLVEGEFIAIKLSEFDPRSVAMMGVHLLVGAAVVGTFLALIFAIASFLLAHFYQQRKKRPYPDELETIVGKVVEHYQVAPRSQRHYVKAKLRFDPLSNELFLLAKERTSWGRVLDAGCGRGQFSLLLATFGGVEAIFGFDHDEAKVKIANDVAHCYKNSALPPPPQEIVFSTGDLRTQLLPQSDTILLLDVLHYLTSSEQQLVIARMCQSLARNGTLIVRETNHGAGLRAKMAGLFEHAGRMLGINQGEELDFRAPSALEEDLRAQGMTVTRHASQGVLDNVMLVAHNGDQSNAPETSMLRS